MSNEIAIYDCPEYVPSKKHAGKDGETFMQLVMNKNYIIKPNNQKDDHFTKSTQIENRLDKQNSKAFTHSK